MQDIPPQDTHDALKSAGAAAGALLALFAVWGRLNAGCRSLGGFCKDFAALPRRARETHAIVIGHERMLELYLSASSTASFHSDGNGFVVRSSREFDRLASSGDVTLQSRAWRNLFAREERGEIDRLWREAVAGSYEFTFEGHIQTDEEHSPMMVRIKAVPLVATEAGSGLWFGIIREA